MTRIHKPATGVAALTTALLLIMIAAPVAFATVPPPDPTRAAAPRVTFVYQNSGMALWAMVLIALGAGAVGALLTLATEHLTRSHRPHVLAA